MKPVKLLIALLLALLPSLMRVQADTTVFALLGDGEMRSVIEHLKGYGQNRT